MKRSVAVKAVRAQPVARCAPDPDPVSPVARCPRGRTDRSSSLETAAPRRDRSRGAAARGTPRGRAARHRVAGDATRRVARSRVDRDRDASRRAPIDPRRSIPAAAVEIHAQLAFVRTRFFSLARRDSFDVALTTSSLPFLRSLKTEKLTAAVTVGTAAALANPLVAEAAITPSLKNTLLSVVAGGIVLAAIGVAVVGVSTFDKVSRK